MSEFIQAPPIAENFIKTLRKFGYTMQSAIADIIDNSISASAKNINIIYLPNSKWLSIIDDGNGMTKNELISAMTPGSFDPDLQRQKGDLGRFGSGLKTASWSQAKVLVVITKKKGKIFGAKWDLDIVEKKKGWLLEIISSKDIKSLMKDYSIKFNENGTAIIWDNIDSIQGSNKAELEKDQDEKIANTIDHIELTYHRFIDAGPKDSIKILFNGRVLKAFDPFFTKNSKTHREEAQQVPAGDADGSFIYLTAFTIPHDKFLSADETNKSESNDGLYKNQGFYIYREKRLIMHGGWFGLQRFKEISKLARVMVDVPSSLDSNWVTDVKKSNMNPPPIVRNEMKNLMMRFDGRSKKVITFSGKRSEKSSNTWEILKLDNKYKFVIKSSNPSFKNFEKTLTKKQKIIFQKLITQFQEDLPWEAIYSYFASGDLHYKKDDE